MFSPLEHFELSYYAYFYFLFLNLSLTNLAFYLAFSNFFLLFIYLMIANYFIIPSAAQLIFEKLYIFIFSLLKQQIKSVRAWKLFPLILFFFLFIFFLNFSSLISYNVAITGHLLVTMTYAFSTFLGLIIIGLLNYQNDFFNLFQPKDVPKILFPMFVIIEFVSFIIRPFSLSIRLFANMLAGHTLMSIFASFGIYVINTVVLLFFFPFLFIFFIIILEAAVAVIQAYVFIILLIIYFNDIFELAH